MSETNETPKRKRRTKEEIEAAKAAGTYKPRGRKKVEEAPKEATDEQKAPEEFQAKPTKLPAEQSVLIMACLQPEVSRKVTDYAKEKGVEVVILEDRVIHDYLSVRDREDKEVRSLGDFLNDTSNRLHAEDQCVKLWMILTKGQPIENAEQRVFTRTEVVKATNLTHNKADQVFQLLRAFGMLRFTKGTHEFVLNFSKKKCHDTIKTEVLAMCKALNNDILRYKASIEADTELTKEQKDEMYKELQRAVDETIEY